MPPKQPECCRRAWLRQLTATAAGTLGSPCFSTSAALPSEVEHPPPTADAMILLWMAGGMASTETFDPKSYVPFSPGIESKRVLSTFPAIDTVVDNIRFTEGLEEMASVIDSGTLIRTYTAPIVNPITHARYQYLWHTGYQPPLTVAAPHIGSVIARTLGPRNPDMPAFIDIGESLAEGSREAQAIRAFLSAGFLGSRYGPFMVPDPRAAAEQLHSTVGPARSDARVRAFRQLLAASPALSLSSSEQQQSMITAFEDAYRLMKSPAAKAFDLTLETTQTCETYNTSPFGLGCLLARRLVEAGARFIEVHIPYKPVGYWDTHHNGHTRTATVKKMIDRPVAQLIRDLRIRGLLDRTLVVLASEFSRDVLVEGRVDHRAKHHNDMAVARRMPDMKHYGMHAHFADAGSVLLFGGGIKKGFVYGKTADEHPCKTIDKPVLIEDLHATLYHAMGISPKTAYEVERRPFYVTRDGLGKPIVDLFDRNPDY